MHKTRVRVEFSSFCRDFCFFKKLYELLSTDIISGTKAM